MKPLRVLFILIFLVAHDLSHAQKSDSSNWLTVNQMQRDISILEASLTVLHPGLYRYNSPSQIQAYVRQLRQQSVKPLPIQTFYRYLSQFTTKLHCGHTYPNPFNLDVSIQNQLFTNQVLPLYFRICDNKWIVTNNLSDNQTIKTGDIILSINQIPVHQIVDSLLTVSRSDGLKSQAKKIDNLNLTPALAANYALFDQYFSLFFPTVQSEFILTLQSPPAAPRQVRVTSLTKAERQNRFTDQFGRLPQKQATWLYRSIDKQTAYLKIGDLAIWGWHFDARRYLDSVFTDIQQHQYTRLVVDIRGCEGGDDDTRNELLSYLMKQPFGCADPTRLLYRSLAIPDSLLPYLQTWNPSFKQPKLASDYQRTDLDLYEKRSTSDATCQSVALKSNRFKGKLCLLIDGANSSTTFTLADWLQQAKVGRLVGSPTGGTKQGLNGGQFLFLHLPGSRIEVDIPLVYQAPSRHRPDQSVIPDRLIRCDRSSLLDPTVDIVLQRAIAEFTVMK